jgi:hypothetical protein
MLAHQTKEECTRFVKHQKPNFIFIKRKNSQQKTKLVVQQK